MKPNRNSESSNSVIFVGGFNINKVNENFLYNEFIKFGEIKSVNILLVFIVFKV